MVIVIMGILATLIVPRYLPQTERARGGGEATGFLSAIRQGEASYSLDNGGNYLALPATSTNADWDKIGVKNPNNSAKYFTFTVAVGTPPTTFTATATRNSVSDAGGNSGKTITLNDAGTWGGTHPNVPSN